MSKSYTRGLLGRAVVNCPSNATPPTLVSISSSPSPLSAKLCSMSVHQEYIIKREGEYPILLYPSVQLFHEGMTFIIAFMSVEFHSYTIAFDKGTHLAV